MLGFTELVAQGTPPDHAHRAYLDEVRAAGGRAAALVAQLLAFSRPQPVQLVTVNLNDVLVQAQSWLGRVLGPQVEVQVQLAAELGYVETDVGQLEQVILNLALNARDAMPTGGQLTLATATHHLTAGDSAGWSAPPGHYICLSVQDTGEGMDAPTRARIFEPFFTTKPVGQGTGLGLATVHRIVTERGGHLAVHSVPGQGTRFDLVFPAVEAPPPSPATVAARTVTPRGTETILLVEDEDGVRTLAETVLRSLGYTVLSAPHGQAALVTAVRHPGPVDLLVTDVAMPGLSGPEVAAGLAERYPTLRVLFMSGFTTDPTLRERLADGDRTFLAKPFTPLALAQRVRAILDAQSPAQSAT
jgi:CheY-like chemotaxis protein